MIFDKSFDLAHLLKQFIDRINPTDLLTTVNQSGLTRKT